MTDSLPTSAPQPLCPEIHFRSRTITDKRGEEFSFATSELVRKGAPLVTLTEATPPPERAVCLQSGQHTVLGENNDCLLAAVDGYPFLSRHQGSEAETITISIIPLLSIADDEMEASITLYPPVPGCSELTAERLVQILRENGIEAGLDTQQLTELIRQCREEEIILSDKTIARGILPHHGKDSFLRFDIEVGPLPGKILGNGTIDFRERKMFVGIKKGEAIARKIGATAGTPGVDVLGKTIPQQVGRDIPVTISNDAEYDESSGIIRALRSGILSMVNENSINVCAKQVISGDIDFSTGNIESKDAVEISGSLLPGFEVRTQGDLLIGGSVRSAFIHCRGNLVIKEGIIGDHGEIQVRGDADFNFIEQGRIKCSGRVIIRKQCYYSYILADGDIHCHEESKVMSGMLLSSGSISLGSVGSSNASPATISAGVEPERYLQLLKVRSRLREKEKALQLWLQHHGQQATDSHRQTLEEAISSLGKELHDISLPPDSDSATPDATISYLRGISIIVHRRIFAGTILQIGNATKTLSQDLESVRFLLNSAGNSIIETKL